MFFQLLRQDTDDDVHAFIPMTSRFAIAQLQSSKIENTTLAPISQRYYALWSGGRGRRVNESMLALSFLWVICHHSVGSAFYCDIDIYLPM